MNLDTYQGIVVRASLEANADGAMLMIFHPDDRFDGKVELVLAVRGKELKMDLPAKLRKVAQDIEAALATQATSVVVNLPGEMKGPAS